MRKTVKWIRRVTFLREVHAMHMDEVTDLTVRHARHRKASFLRKVASGAPSHD